MRIRVPTIKLIISRDKETYHGSDIKSATDPMDKKNTILII